MNSITLPTMQVVQRLRKFAATNQLKKEALMVGTATRLKLPGVASCIGASLLVPMEMQNCGCWMTARHASGLHLRQCACVLLPNW